MAEWHRFEELRPDALVSAMSMNPVVFWPLGLIEHHGWHLPVGFDGLKAERLCIRIAEKTGGLLMPVMWWGADGGHSPFNWTFYQDRESARRIVLETVEKLIQYGAHVIVLMMGHYPWDGLLNSDGDLEKLRELHPEVLILDGTEVSLTAPGRGVPEGDHAALQETLYGMALLPELVELDALKSGHEKDVWPVGTAIETLTRFPGVEYDPDSPFYAQMGEDPRTATIETAEKQVLAIVDSVVESIYTFIRYNSTK